MLSALQVRIEGFVVEPDMKQLLKKSERDARFSHADAVHPDCVSPSANRGKGNDLLPSCGYVPHADGSEIKTLDVAFCFYKPSGAVPFVCCWFVQTNFANARSLIFAENKTPVLG